MTLVLGAAAFACASGKAAALSVAAHGMVAAAESSATDAGVRMLERGGNAFDAAVAVAFALGVTHPTAGSLGGGGFCVATLLGGGAFALDFRETAPRRAHRDMFLDASREPIPGASLRTSAASGVPGTPDGLLRLLEEHGTLSRSDVLAPAIALARDGMRVSPSLAQRLVERREQLTAYDATRALFFAGGDPPAAGDVFVQPDLARTLQRIEAQGRAGFYEGETARRIAAYMEATGGLIDEQDLRAYRSRVREPLVFERWGMQLVTHPLPSSGGIVLSEILGLLDPDQLAAAGFQSAEYVRQIVEAERLAYADRNHYLGDPDFVESPVAALLSEEYLATRRRELPATGAGRSEGVGPGPVEPEETTNFCVADAQGNVVVVTFTLNDWFGSGAVVPGTGIFLNNEMDDFSMKPGVPNLYGLTGGDANAIAPGKRPLSSMTPTIVRKGDRLVLAVGSPGGSTIITTVLQVLLNVVLWDRDVGAAIDAGRFHHQWLPDQVFVEPGTLDEAVREQLAAWGYELTDKQLGRATGIVGLPDGGYAGHADRRVSGKAAGL